MKSVEKEDASRTVMASCSKITTFDNYVEVAPPQVIDTTNMGFENEVREYNEYAPSLKAGRSGLMKIEQ